MIKKWLEILTLKENEENVCRVHNVCHNVKASVKSE